MRFAFRNLFCPLLAFTWPVAASLGQSTHPTSQQSTPPGQSSSQNPPSQTQSQTQALPQDKQDPVADAARKAREKRAAAAKGKVFTEDDLSVLKGGVSVVGTEITKPT